MMKMTVLDHHWHEVVRVCVGSFLAELQAIDSLNAHVELADEEPQEPVREPYDGKDREEV